MNNEIEVGEFVRLNYGKIDKVTNTDYYMQQYIECEKGTYLKENIKTHSKNKVELVENGDYVNGWKVLAKTKIKNNEMQVCILTAFEDEHWITINNETLKTIVTKESFKEREYVF